GNEDHFHHHGGGMRHQPRGPPEARRILAPRAAIDTGARNGTGRAVAMALAQAGAHAVAADIDAALAHATAEAAGAAGPKSLGFETDVGDLGAIDRMVERAVATFCRVDILLNNARVTPRAHIMDLTATDLD